MLIVVVWLLVIVPGGQLQGPQSSSCHTHTAPVSDAAAASSWSLNLLLAAGATWWTCNEPRQLPPTGPASVAVAAAAAAVTSVASCEKLTPA
jgi:hypothetical protein